MSTTNRIFLSPPFVGAAERRAVKAAFDSGYVAPCGPQVDEFERRLAKLAGRRYAVAVASGTAAIDLLMAEFAVDRTWTVIAPTLTFIATVGPAAHRGAKLVFVDCNLVGTMDVALLEQALRERQGKKCLVLGVDLYGNCCDYAAIGKLCRRYGAIFICDSAEAVGATRGGKPAGSAGVAAVYSFNGNKLITTSGGGAILTDSKALAERAKKRAQQSRENVLWYEHQEVGYNYRLSNLLAALGLAQLDRLPAILKKRAKNFNFYQRHWGLSPKNGGLSPANGVMMVPEKGANHWLTIAVMNTPRERDRLLRRFAAANIEARPVWKPLHLQPVFKGCKVYGGEVATALFERGICLPSGTGLTAADFKRIGKVLG